MLKTDTPAVRPDEALGTLFEAHMRLLCIGSKLQELADDLLKLFASGEVKGTYSLLNLKNAISNVSCAERHFINGALECLEAAMNARRGGR